MSRHITVIDLKDKANFFAYKIGILAIEKDRYVCEALDQDGEKLHTQTFISIRTYPRVDRNHV